MSQSALDPKDVARDVASKWEIGPPVRIDALFDLIADLGARVQQSERLIESGLLRHSHEGLVVTLRLSDSAVRKKFTAAHELGHLLCEDFEWADPEDEERWCNEFAGELLLPGRWISAIFRSRPESMDTLRSIAARAQVSIPFSLVSAHQHLGWQSALLKFRFSRNEWRLWDTGYVPLSLGSAIQLPASAGDVLSIAVPFTRLVELPFVVRGKQVTIQAEISGESSTRWVLVAANQIQRLERIYSR